ncbi:hypothetical protein [uncultured Tateyamaria sp.]|uniref:hypothetical protein n=1 Tax=uncultured Tateyamaria sp. TaxID=455651 RepID=UPI00263611CD|nr:hypothetical protein [uncultured Tateyamaria sp.]
MKKTVYLHIGQSKTGSSYIQSMFALSRQELGASGIEYPAFSKGILMAEKGHVSWGNVDSIADIADLIQRAAAEAPDASKLLFSGEHLLQLFDARFGPNGLEALRDEFDFNILLFVRDPLDHMVSIFKQRKKTGRFSGALESFAASYNAPAMIERVLGNLNAQGYTHTVFNYSNNAQNLHALVAGWLGIPSDRLEDAPDHSINRSLTASEVFMQTTLSGHLDQKDVLLIGTMLCNLVPDVSPDPMHISEPVLAGFLDRMTKVCAQTNDLLPSGQHYNLPTLAEAIAKYPAADDAEALTFSKQQIAAVSKAFGMIVERNKGRV